VTSVRRNTQLAFLLGFGMSFLPSFGPFAGLLFVLTNRLRLRRADVTWGLAALLSAVAVGAHRGLLGAAFGALQVLGPWAVFRAFTEIRHPPLAQLRRPALLNGLFAGFVVLVALGLGHVSLDLAYPTVTQAIVWGGNPTLFAHMVLVVGSLIALLAADGLLRAATLTITSLTLLAAGSLEAIFGLLVVLAFLSLRALVRRRLAAGIAPVLLAAVLVIVVAYGPQLGLGRTGYLIAPASTTPGVNLVRGSELPWGDWWDSRHVSVAPAQVTLAGHALAEYRVSKDGPATWYRLQQVIQLDAGATYTVSAWVLDNGPQESGIQGWGLTGGDGALTLTTRLVDHHLQAGLSGPGRLDAAGIAATQGSWKRIYATFSYGGKAPQINWSVGLAPDARPVAGSTADFAGFQLERGPLTAYRPGAADRGLNFTTGRAEIWRVAWQGVIRRPWLGWGPATFPAFYRASSPVALAPDTEVPAHAHNLFLEVLFERGAVGFLGLLLLLGALLWPALRRRDVGLLAVLAAVLLANVFDYTFFFGGVIYPLAAVAGWRSRSSDEVQPAADSISRQFLVRLGLAAVDLGLAWVAFTLATWLLPLVGATPNQAGGAAALSRYALFLWPAMAWREGLYPGYGLTEPDELKRQVLAATYAGVLFLVGALFFGPELGVDPAVIISATALSAVLTPVGRAAAKRVLRALGLWGRPLVVLGAGATGRRVIEALRKVPLGGLIPVTIFDDDPKKTGMLIEGLQVEGPLAAARDYAARHGVTHAIVAMPSLSPSALAAVIQESTSVFRRVQFVPELPGIPTEDVFVSELDKMLALEVRGGLYAPENRVAKRAIDLAGGLVLTLLVSPILVALYLWVRLDTRGPGFHRSERLGENGRLFRCYKFRTMQADAERMLQDLLRSDPGLAREYAAFHKLRNDPRVTRVGRFLRKTSLDELPQLFNVILGQMSLVGPRPYLARELETIGEYADILFRAKPGITGYWQVSARNEVTFHERVLMESHYVRNWSIWWDVILLVQTPEAVLKSRGAR